MRLVEVVAPEGRGAEVAQQEMAQRLLTFALNVVAIAGAAAGVYALLGMRPGFVRRFTTRAAAK